MAKGFEFKLGGRTVNQKQFMDGIKQKMLDQAFAAIEEKVRGTAGAIVDPQTGKRPAVFVRRKGNDGYVIRTEGSPEFARELERRLGLEKGQVENVTVAAKEVPHVYLAHASEDHESLARPLAEKLMAAGIEVWLDAWEIRTGDSLRRKMESGLSDCTHFVVLLTENSIGKPWVETEIDAGFLQAVQGESRFMGLRIGVPITRLSPFLKTLRCPETDLDDEAEVAALIADIHGVSTKPPRGEKPTYVQNAPSGIEGWSASAVAVARYLVTNSVNGCKFDPQTTVAKVAEATGLPEEDVRLGVLDLSDSALIETQRMDDMRFWPLIGLFVEFDRHFLDFDNQKDAVAVANRLVSEGVSQADIAEDVASWFADWPVRRLNSALAYLEESKVIDAHHSLGQPPYVMSFLFVTDRTRRFVRDHG
ncbi:toll/interleukin-1 receptor domain-containing protein [Phenylobacterium sp.]|uniref:toll/interleukin-1 receptor domain-containing protein n=1 Tax=Phenylobacterium sp. TaxID=1871053 RepID=UPI0035B20807